MLFSKVWRIFSFEVRFRAECLLWRRPLVACSEKYITMCTTVVCIRNIMVIHTTCTCTFPPAKSHRLRTHPPPPPAPWHSPQYLPPLFRCYAFGWHSLSHCTPVGKSSYRLSKHWSYRLSSEHRGSIRRYMGLVLPPMPSIIYGKHASLCIPFTSPSHRRVWAVSYGKSAYITDQHFLS